MANVNEAARFEALSESRQPWAVQTSRAVLRFARVKPVGGVSAAVVAVLILVGVFAPLLAPYAPLDISGVNRLKAPTVAHLMGTDEQGRDVLSRLIFGARVSLYVACGAVVITLVVGGAIGILSGYMRGATENPASAGDIQAKFRDNAGMALPPRRVRALIEAVEGLDKQDSMGRVVRLTVPARRAARA